jgi:hypothetical protein
MMIIIIIKPSSRHLILRDFFDSERNVVFRAGKDTSNNSKKKTNRDRDHEISVCTRVTVMNHKTPKVC